MHPLAHAVIGWHEQREDRLGIPLQARCSSECSAAIPPSAAPDDGIVNIASAEKGITMFCNSCNNGIWLIILIIILFGWGGNGCGCNNNCGCDNNCGCNNGCC